MRSVAVRGGHELCVCWNTGRPLNKWTLVEQSSNYPNPLISTRLSGANNGVSV